MEKHVDRVHIISRVRNVCRWRRRKRVGITSWWRREDGFLVFTKKQVNVLVRPCRRCFTWKTERAVCRVMAETATMVASNVGKNTITVVWNGNILVSSRGSCSCLEKTNTGRSPGRVPSLSITAWIRWCLVLCQHVVSISDGLGVLIFPSGL